MALAGDDVTPFDRRTKTSSGKEGGVHQRLNIVKGLEMSMSLLLSSLHCARRRV